MKRLSLLLFFGLSFLSSCASCENDTAISGNNGDSIISTRTKMTLKIGNNIFTATLYDNATTTAFKKLLPLTVDMVELNGNEKYVDLSRSLPTNASNPGIIQAGDLMLYSWSTLVLFYKTLSTSYNYTKLGRVDDVEGLATALGSGNATVKFALE